MLESHSTTFANPTVSVDRQAAAREFVMDSFEEPNDTSFPLLPLDLCRLEAHVIEEVDKRRASDKYETVNVYSRDTQTNPRWSYVTSGCKISILAPYLLVCRPKDNLSES